MFREHPFDGFIGIGLGGAEQKGPCKEFGPVFEKAIKDKYHAVAHAGEDVGPESIWDALRILHAERIGHGISSVQDEELVKYLCDKRVPVEVCPTSNVFTKKYVKKMTEHPVREMFDKGIPVTIATDDPIFFGVELIDEYWNLYSKLKFSKSEIKQLILNSFEDSFLSSSEKFRYKNLVDEKWS